jgi:hypothetical protein
MLDAVGTKLFEFDSKATKRPSPPAAGWPENTFPEAPVLSAETSTVLGMQPVGAAKHASRA